MCTREVMCTNVQPAIWCQLTYSSNCIWNLSQTREWSYNIIKKSNEEKKLVVTENIWSIVQMKGTKIDGLLDWTESSTNVFQVNCRKPLKFKLKIMTKKVWTELICDICTALVEPHQATDFWLKKHTAVLTTIVQSAWFHFTKGECSEMKVAYGFEYVRVTSVGIRWRIGMQVHDRGTNSLMWHWVMCVSNEKEIWQKICCFSLLEMFIILITNKSVLKVEPILFIK